MQADRQAETRRDTDVRAKRRTDIQTDTGRLELRDGQTGKQRDGETRRLELRDGLTDRDRERQGG